MTGNEYQKLAMRTNDGEASKRLGTLLDAWVDCIDIPDFGGMVNGCFGLAGESGEVLYIVKKWIFHEKGLDRDHLKKELGDVMWYVAMICESAGFTLDEIMKMNIDKLKSRYPEGFDTQRANHRQEGDI